MLPLKQLPGLGSGRPIECHCPGQLQALQWCTPAGPTAHGAWQAAWYCGGSIKACSQNETKK